MIVERTSLDTIENYVDIFACPDCGGSLTPVRNPTDIAGFVCPACETAFPVKDGIVILLPKSSRNYDLEYEILNELRQYTGMKDDRFARSFDKTLAFLEKRQGEKSWEWEDEEFWHREYERERVGGSPKNWNDRIWQRDVLVSALRRSISLDGKIILDIGAGEGQNFRWLFSTYCNDDSLYIGTDISFEGLRLNRARNRHGNSLYLLCTADAMPLIRETVDIACYFGILHHTEKKESILLESTDLVKKGGFFLLHESLVRPSPDRIAGVLVQDTDESAHEERIDLKKLQESVAASDLQVLGEWYGNTIFYTGMLSLFPRFSISGKMIFKIISGIDTFLMITLGRWIPYFRAGSVMMLLKRIH